MTGKRSISSGLAGHCAAGAVAMIVCVALFTASPAHANSALVAELKARNAHHLAKKVTLPKQLRPPTIEREYGANVKRESWRMSEGELSVTLTLSKGGPPDALLFQTPILSLSAGGRKVLNVEGSESFPDNPIFLVQIAQMDPANPYKEVVFSSFTGGAHCCSDTRILTSSRDGKTWREIELGPVDGELLEVRDIDGDGRYEFVLPDNAFLYTFGCYACSTAPLQVLQLRGGELKDVSGDPAFRPHHVKSLVDMIGWAGDDMDLNGFLAGYVAQKIRLGEGKQAWQLMLKYYDRENDWGRDFCSVKENDKGECPPGKKVVLSFPRALERFFKENGYALKK